MATLSMTGYGSSEGRNGNVEITVELRSVNSRFLDVACKLPTAYYRFESELAKIVRDSLKRGRVELYVGRKDLSEPDIEIRFNEELFGQFLELSQKALNAASVSGSEADVQIVLDILRRREVLEISPKALEIEAEEETLKSVLGEALKELVSMRIVEGGALEREVLGQIKAVEGLRDKMLVLAKSSPELFQERLKARLEKLAPNVDVDEDRLAVEVAILADRADVTEEVVRLESHIKQFRDVVQKGEGGRKLEFLLQEMGREINTIGSKAQQSELTALVVEAKAVAEKIREQVQNIE